MTGLAARPATGHVPLHRTLARQLRRLGLEPDRAPADGTWSAFLDVVTHSYEQADADRYTLERSIEVSSAEMRGLHEVLSRRALHDELTGLFNRAALMERLTSLLAAYRRGAPQIALLFIDLDGFKLVNDSLGHEAGDELLIRTADRIRRVVRPDDMVVRLGGDEFVVVVPRLTDLDAAGQLAARITAELDIPFRIQARDALVSASVGVAVCDQAETPPGELLRRADLAMYAAKTQGRGRYSLFTGQMQSRVDDRTATGTALRSAIESDQLRVRYQPLIRLSDLTVVGAEALLRWQRPGAGLVPPAAFIPVAEEARLIGLLDQWVLEQACRRAARWPAGHGDICVNMSSRSLDGAQVAAGVEQALAASGLDPSRLTLELTESALLGDDPQVATNLAQIRDVGVRLAIDDFGTGYSSLARLRDVPVRVLKLDCSLVADIDTRRDVAAIVAAAVTMGHALGQQVIAEGVERRGQAELLRSMGCDAAQGYLFGRPMDAERLESMLGTRTLQDAAT